MKNSFSVSIIIPCYNSEKTISDLVEQIFQELGKEGIRFEIVLVNDDSKDETFGEIKNICQKHNNVIGVDLSKNFGQHNATMAGMNFISGDLIISIDDDLQIHPKDIIKLTDKIEEGYDLVYGVYGGYKKVRQNIFRKIGSRFNNFVLGHMINQPKGIKTSSFWCAKRFVIEEVKKYHFPYTNLRGLFFRTTANIGNVEVEHFPRKFGKSNYNFRSLVKLWSTCINFSIIPLRVSTYLGIFSALIGFIYGIFIIIRRIFFVDAPLGWSSIMAVFIFFAGIILICLGIIGEYIGRIFISINETPQYIIKEKTNINDV